MAPLCVAFLIAGCCGTETVTKIEDHQIEVVVPGGDGVHVPLQLSDTSLVWEEWKWGDYPVYDSTLAHRRPDMIEWVPTPSTIPISDPNERRTLDSLRRVIFGGIRRLEGIQKSMGAFRTYTKTDTIRVPVRDTVRTVTPAPIIETPLWVKLAIGALGCVAGMVLTALAAIFLPRIKL